MTQLEFYSQTMLPARHRAGGMALQPLCIGHELLLHRLGSPFAAGAGETGELELGDILLTIALCSMSPSDAIRRVDQRWFHRALKCRARLLSLRPRNAAIFELQAELDLRAYLKWHREEPKVWRTDRQGRPPGAPRLLQMHAMLAGFGRTDAQCLDTPLRLASALFCELLEREQSLRLVNERDESSQDAAKQLREELVREGKIDADGNVLAKPASGVPGVLGKNVKHQQPAHGKQDTGHQQTGGKRPLDANENPLAGGTGGPIAAAEHAP